MRSSVDKVEALICEHWTLDRRIPRGTRSTFAFLVYAIIAGLLTCTQPSYVLATELHGHLDDLSGSLSQMIDAVNELSNSSDGAAVSSDDPMAQIAQVLSNHLESLQWIDGAVREVDSKVTEVERRVRAAGGEDALSGGGYGSGPGASKSRGFGASRS